LRYILRSQKKSNENQNGEAQCCQSKDGKSYIKEKAKVVLKKLDFLNANIFVAN
jgi:hypothetical protein